MIDRPRITAPALLARKQQGERIAMIAAYDYPSARMADEAGLDAILVGDSLGMVVHGHSTTLPVTLELMLHHVRAVARADTRALVIADMPFLTHQVTVEEGIRTAGRLVQEGGAHAVKLEGGASSAELIARLTQCGIPVMGHIGLMPQSLHGVGGFRVQGRTPKRARELLEDARAVERAGAFALVLELVPTELAREITSVIGIPTIGIGAGPECDGQILLFHDMLGLNGARPPRHARCYANLGEQAAAALRRYADEVRTGEFPGEAETVGQPELNEDVTWKS